MINVYQDECVEDLRTKGLRLIQNKHAFRFGEDSVLLSWYAAKNSVANPKFIDLCSGSGIVSILFHARMEGSRGVTVDVSDAMASLMDRNMKLNNLEDILPYQGDIVKASNTWLPMAKEWEEPWNQFDTVLMNPPYLETHRGPMPRLSLPSDQDRLLARQEEIGDLKAYIHAAAQLLRPKGKLFLVHRSHRLPQVMQAIQTQNFAISSLQVVYPSPVESSKIFLIAATKLGKTGFSKVEPPLIIRETDGTYTKHLLAIYNNKEPLSEQELWVNTNRLMESYYR